MTQLEEQIKVVAASRNWAIELRNQRDALLEEWNKTNQELFDALTQAGAKVAEVETLLRELTLKAYAETGNKAPAVGVGIREVTKLDYDPKEAYRWGLEHKLALSLDKKAFETIAKTSEALDFVTISQEPQATIATKLDVEGGE